MKANRGRIPAYLAVVVLILACFIALLGVESGGDVIEIGLGFVLAATSMGILRRAYPPVP